MKNAQHNIFRILFFDVETVSQAEDFQHLQISSQNLWSHKARNLTKLSWSNNDSQLIEDLYAEKAAIYAEFGKIVCISVGILVKENGFIQFKTKSFTASNEKVLIRNFLQLVGKHFNDPSRYGFCGHNIREFDIPYICRRALINGLTLPDTLNISGKKAWQLHHFYDTLQMWKFGDYKHYTSLNLMCDVFGIPSPKSKMDGSQVGECFWKEGDISKISSYCEQDVQAVAMLYCKMTGQFEQLVELPSVFFDKLSESAVA